MKLIRQAIKKAFLEAVGAEIGDIVTVKNYGEDEPSKKVWNGCIGQIVSKYKDLYTVRITDATGSNLQYSVKWSKKMDKVLKQSLDLTIKEFEILKDEEIK